ncbi:MAG TPA: GTPase ObgE, partial [Arthrobacter sp.]|nr:GTPase ObgE [Arthrobacter sp.]
PTRGQKRDEQVERREAKAAARAELEAERKAGIWTESVSGRRPKPLTESALGEENEE